MAGFWRLMSTQHWPEEVRRLVAVQSAGHIRPFADGTTLVEATTLEQLEALRPAWNDLARRALEPNPFLEPDFALSAALHLPASHRPEFVAVWQGVGFEPRARLIGLWALQRGGGGLPPGVARAWRYKHSALGTPLVDRLAAARSVDEMLKWLARRRGGRSALALPMMVKGPVLALLTERCAANGLAWVALEERSRAVLLPGSTDADAMARARSKKHRRELDRLRRRLVELGEVTSGSASKPEEVRKAIEWFLALEHRGWKGERGTSFLSDVGEAAFVRTLLRLLSRSGKCRIDWISLDGRPIAFAILLMSGDRAYFWKTAYDEDYAQFSPGVQLARDLIERQLAHGTCELTDSCAIADHPMIDRVWPDRLAIVDVLICVDARRAASFPLVSRRERLRGSLRSAAKTLRNGALRRHAS